MKKTLQVLSEKCPLFSGSDSERIRCLLEKTASYRKSFSAGEEILTKTEVCGRIGIILKGGLTVFSAVENGTPLNHLGEGNLFGVSVLFGNCGAETYIRAKTKTEILFIDEEKTEPLWEDKIIRKNLIRFLTDRICFLNRKIRSFTAGSAEGKLATYFAQNASENGIFTVPSSLTQLAKDLNLGRASLYRAIEKMENDGVIKRDKKTIQITEPDALELYF